MDWLKGIKRKFSYKFDNMMAKGMKSMVFLLLVATVIIVLIFGLALGFIDNGLSVLKGIWTSVMHVIDPGTITGDDKDFGYMFLMSCVTVFGIVVTSTLIGIINTGMTLKLEALKKGKSKIIEKGHIVILGFDSEIYTIIDELDKNNADNNRHKKGTVVILDNNYSIDQMRELVERHTSGLKHTNVIYRTGTIYSKDAISLCSVETCESIIINVEDDFVTIKCILSVANILEENNCSNDIYMTAVIKNRDNIEAAINAGKVKNKKQKYKHNLNNIEKNIKNRVLILNFEDIIANIIAQSSRQIGISSVYEELFSFDNSEFYIVDPKSDLFFSEISNNKELDDVNIYYPNATCVGIMRGRKAKLYPLIKDRKIYADDKLIFIAEDQSVIKPRNINNSNSIIKRELFSNELFIEEKPKNILILRYSSKIEKILKEEFCFLPKGSKITIAVERQVERVQQMLDRLEYNHEEIECNVVKYSTFNRKNLEQLLEEDPDSVIVLSNTSDDVHYEVSEKEIQHRKERDDAEIMYLLLQLRTLKNNGYKFTIASEIQYIEDQKLAQNTDVNDFIVGSRITNMILAQIAVDRRRYTLFQDIISSEGSNINMEPAGNYVKLGVEVDLFTAGAAVAEANSVSKAHKVLIGYKKEDENEFKIIDNKEDIKIFWEKDMFIVIDKMKEKKLKKD